MFFSVILPLYNKAQYVAKAINSVLSQTFSDYELIIVDDGSTDNSADIALQSISGYKQCHFIRQGNAGVSVARNIGVSNSHGEYICFLDADDWWEPIFLEEMTKMIAEFPDAGIYGTNYTIVNETKNKTRVAQIGLDSGFERGYINYCQSYTKTMYMPLWTGAVCIPRHVFDEMHGFPQGIKLGEDFLLWVRIALKYQVAFLNKPLAFYNQDVNVENRGVGHLHKPNEHMLWNVGFLSNEEKSNFNYKQLIDSIRIYGLLPYYISKEYHEEAKRELDKVDWTGQPLKKSWYYRLPMPLLRVVCELWQLGADIKHKTRKSINLRFICHGKCMGNKELMDQ